MCCSPVIIKNPSVYKVAEISATMYTVPCGKCEDCRNAANTEWQTRLMYEVNDYYNRGGKCIFLTFTYNNDNLPYFDFETEKYGACRIPCFSHDHVKSYIKTLKTLAWRRYGKGSFRYFFVSEYGKNTRRPHYHVIYFLENHVDSTDFAELCRSCWHHGFMFPKYNSVKKCYVDNDNNPLEYGVELKKKDSSASYIAKYSTKDLSYYSIPELSEFLTVDFPEIKKTIYNNDGLDAMRAYKRYVNSHLPKHFQSTNLGACILDDDIDNLLNYVKNGIPNCFKPSVTLPLPSYVVNKLLYKNVKSSRVGIDGNVLYDRYLTDFGKIYLREVYENKVSRFSKKVVNLLNNYAYVKPFLSELGFDSRTYLSLVEKLLPFGNLSTKISNVHYVAKNSYVADSQCLSSALKIHKEVDLLNTDVCFDLYFKQKDLQNLKKLAYGKMIIPCTCPLPSLLSDYIVLEDMICKVMALISHKKSQSILEKFEEAMLTRRKFCAKFDTKLC